MLKLEDYLEGARRHLKLAEQLKEELREASSNDTELVETRMASHHLLLALEHLSKHGLPTTAAITQTAPTEAGQWDAGESTSQKTPASSHLLGNPTEEDCSHVAQCFECQVRVEKLRLSYRTHAQAVHGLQSSSTYRNADSSRFAEH